MPVCGTSKEMVFPMTTTTTTTGAEYEYGECYKGEEAEEGGDGTSAQRATSRVGNAGHVPDPGRAVFPVVGRRSSAVGRRSSVFNRVDAGRSAAMMTDEKGGRGTRRDRRSTTMADETQKK